MFTKKLSCVLLIEDDPISCFIAKKVIISKDLCEDLHVCFSGEEALEYLSEKLKLNQKAPDLIFFDINLPGIDGYNFFSQFQKLEFDNIGDVKVCVLTNSSYQQDMEKFSMPGIYKYLLKPLTKSALENI